MGAQKLYRILFHVGWGSTNNTIIVTLPSLQFSLCSVSYLTP